MNKKYIFSTMLTLTASLLFTLTPVKVRATEVNIPQPQETSENFNQISVLPDNSQQYYTVRFQNPSEDVTELYIPVWSLDNGQDDICWYPAEQKSDGAWECTVDISRHNFATGTYEAHVYTQTSEGMKFLTGTQFEVSSIAPGSLTCDMSMSNKGIYQLNLAGTTSPAGIRDVQIAVWSQNNGQDDIHWYRAEFTGGTWYTDIDISTHGYDSGTYIAHAYVTDNRGVQRIAGNTTFEVLPVQKNQLSCIISPDFSNVTITLKNADLPTGTESVLFPVWGIANGQNDIVWYPAKRLDNYTYQAILSLSEHGETGLYNAHAYAATDNASPVFIGGDTFTVKTLVPKAIVEKDDANGLFTIVITDIQYPDSIQSISVPVWSEKNGQDDIRWYTAQRYNNQWSITVDIANHNMDTGLYIAHVYTQDSSGSLSLLINTTVDVVSPSSKPSVQCDVQTDLASVTLTVHNLSGVTAVKVPVWGEVNGQNDIQWYDAKKIDNRTWEVTVPLKNHMETGTYQAHVYGVSNGGMQLVTHNVFNIEELPADLQTGTRGLTDLENQIQNIIAAHSGQWSVYVKNLNTNEYLLINDQAMGSASVIKLFVMEYIYSQIETGQFSKSILNQQLLNAMISTSSNEATNELVRRLSGCNDHYTGTVMLNNHMQEAGYTSGYLAGTLHPSSSAYAYYGGRNSTSAWDCGRLLESIYRRECVSSQASSEMLDMLLNQQIRTKIPAGLPAGTTCANKTGDHEAAQNDVAIVYSPQCDYIICIFSNFFTSEYEAVSGVQAISATTYNYFNP